MLTIADVDLDRFARVFEATVAPCFNGWDYPRHFRGYNGVPLLSVGVKTYRTAMHGGDCDAQGSAWPDKTAMDVARKLAADLGFEVKWEECEKGWGSLYFSDLGTRA